MTKNQHNLVYSTDARTGRLCVGVRLPNCKDRAWLYEADYRRITDEFGQTPFYLNDNGQGAKYVRLKHPGRDNLHMVARLVTGEKPRKVIKYHDGNRLNLRSDNLMVASGHGGAKHKRPKVVQPDEFATEMSL